MKRVVMIVLSATVFSFIGTYAHAGNGDLVVNGHIAVGTVTPTADKIVSSFDPTSAAEFQFKAASPTTFGIIGLMANSGEGYYNPMVNQGDNAIIFSGTANGWEDGNLVIGPWSGELSGIKILADGKVGIGTPNPGYKLEVNGSFGATVKSFDIRDPRYTDGRRRLVHASLEGPEVGVYYRGETKLDKGTATVTLPAYFEALTSSDNRTVLLTAKFEQDGDLLCSVAASAVTNGGFTIRAYGVPDPSLCGHKVYWEVVAERSDVGKLKAEVIRDDYPGKKINNNVKRPFK